MKIIKKIAKSLPILFALFVIHFQVSFGAETMEMSRAVLMENKVNLSSNKIIAKTIKVVFPPAFKTPWHTHEGPGPRYIIKGKLKVSEGGVTSEYKAGDVFWESGKMMSVENIGNVTAELIIVELVAAKN